MANITIECAKNLFPKLPEHLLLAHSNKDRLINTRTCELMMDDLARKKGFKVAKYFSEVE